MKKSIGLLLGFALLVLFSPTTYAADFTYKQEIYDQANVGDRDMYELITKGFSGRLADFDNAVEINSSLIGLSKEDVIGLLGAPNYEHGHFIVYFTKSERARFPVIALRFSEKMKQLKYMYFPLNSECLVKYVQGKTVEGFFGKPDKKTSGWREYLSDDKSLKVTICWSGVLDRHCTGVILGDMSSQWEHLKLPLLRSNAFDSMSTYRLRSTMTSLEPRMKEMDDMLKKSENE